MADLVFKLPTGSKDLVLGALESTPDVDAHIQGSLPGLSGVVFAGRLFPATINGSFPGLTGEVTAQYKSMVDRPVVARLEFPHQDAAPLETGVQSAHQDGQIAETGPQSPWGRANLLQTAISGAFSDGVRDRKVSRQARHQDAMRLPVAQVRATHQDGLRDRRLSRVSRFQAATPTRIGRHNDWQDRYRDRRPARKVPWGAGAAVRRVWLDIYGAADALEVGLRGRYQEAMRPPPGTSGPVVPPPPDPCYLPDANLLFTQIGSSAHLVFRCDLHPDPTGQTVVVPIRRVYVTVNSASLIRVAGSVPIPTYNMTMSLDVDSWTWSFGASVPGSALANLQPSVPGDPVEVQATVNGVAYRFYIENLAWERVFGRTSVRVTGRGKTAALDAPYAPILSFGSDTTKTAQQLANDALSFNSVPLGWTIDWNLDDWSVPGGTWSHQGSYISALNAIAGAAGAYVQPHNTDDEVAMLLRYPVPAWEWGTVTPDYVLPADVVSQESINFINKPNYNRVYVSGQRNGVLGRYTRAGTAGDLLAQPVVDPLITAAAAVRQRGRAILSDSGPMAMVGLRLPVLALTGIIKPGKFVEYDDGGTVRIGLTRGVSVDIDMPTIYQTLTVETHG